MASDPVDSSQRTRREFFIQAAQRTGGAGLAAALLASVERASAIAAEAGTTYLDAEHIVILMQENRSFDHVYGTLRGVRGFNDPRAITLPNQNPVWLQTNAAGETYAPFRLGIKETNATWLGGLPHSWADQTDARNHGNCDKWLDAKPSNHKDGAGKPLTLGYYDRSDLPFYYELADAFTICDQHFCSSLTGTTSNRLYLWTGTIRERQNAAAAACVRNSDVDYDHIAKWPTFPERLEDAGISWRIYQNEVSLPTGLNGEEDAWLANFTDNPIEWFEQYHGRFSKTFRSYATKAVKTLPGEIAEIDRKLPRATGADATRLNREKRSKERTLRMAREAETLYTDAAYARLTPKQRSLHERAFTTNAGDPAYRELATLRYRDGDTERELKAPKGDVLHQFRKDVDEGKLPAVSWIVPPENFSDHPGAPWYGAWLVSEVLNILTRNPEVWKKTIFILDYDENDGYFDHVTPFAAPNPEKPETGKVSVGIDAALEYWPLDRDAEKRPVAEARGSSIGLGFRVPMVVASPWSRGGYVCSQVFDHTSVLQFLEKFLSHKSGKAIRETNISEWRRTVCGDLTSVFQTATADGNGTLRFPARDAVIEGIHKAQFRQLPAGFRKLSADDVSRAVRDRNSVAWMPRQEPGVRASLPIPYELYAGGKLSADRKSLEITMAAGKRVFGARSVGAPFHVYAPRGYGAQAALRNRAYAVKAGDELRDLWALDGFENDAYHLRVAGPNGFLREMTGGVKDPGIEVHCAYVARSGDVEIVLTNSGSARAQVVEVVDNAYGNGGHSVTVKPGTKKSVVLRLARSHAWYDFTVRVAGAEAYSRRCAGRVETGKPGFSDPAMAGGRA